MRGMAVLHDDQCHSEYTLREVILERPDRERLIAVIVWYNADIVGEVTLDSDNVVLVGTFLANFIDSTAKFELNPLVSSYRYHCDFFKL